MDQYITGSMIKRLREERGMTQAQLAERIFVSDKTVSKWETGRGYPDITLLEPLAAALGVSVIELFKGCGVVNKNRAFNLLKMKFSVCPVCGNVITSVGEAVVSCCGITLPPLEASDPDEGHAVAVQRIEDEYFVTAGHEMTKSHYVSFIAAVRDDCCEVKKLYPEGPAEARFGINGTRYFFVYCNRHGLFVCKR
ncbi:MAG: helix-turn-helix domain-containing protein [Clostridia bacterium]|nr:helix-turn-helix domain-containing protein [Clostridia bacterium]